MFCRYSDFCVREQDERAGFSLKFDKTGDLPRKNVDIMAEAMQEADEHGAMEVEVDDTPAPDS